MKTLQCMKVYVAFTSKSLIFKSLLCLALSEKSELCLAWTILWSYVMLLFKKLSSANRLNPRAASALILIKTLLWR